MKTMQRLIELEKLLKVILSSDNKGSNGNTSVEDKWLIELPMTNEEHKQFIDILKKLKA